MDITISNDLNEAVQFLPLTGKAVVTKRSPFSGKMHRATLTLTTSDYDTWMGGTLIQKALPHLTAEEREFLMTGTTPAEWATAFGPGDDE